VVAGGQRYEDVAAEAITQVQHYEADKTAGDRVEQVGQKILNVHVLPTRRVSVEVAGDGTGEFASGVVTHQLVRASTNT